MNIEISESTLIVDSEIKLEISSFVKIRHEHTML